MAILFICIAVCPRCLERYLVLFCRNREGQLGQTASNYRATGSNIRTCYPRIDSRIPPRHRQRSCRPQLEESTESNTHFIRRPPGVRKYKKRITCNPGQANRQRSLDRHSAEIQELSRKYREAVSTFGRQEKEHKTTGLSGAWNGRSVRAKARGRARK
jgi:hypothetical protein